MNCFAPLSCIPTLCAALAVALPSLAFLAARLARRTAPSVRGFFARLRWRLFTGPMESIARRAADRLINEYHHGYQLHGLVRDLAHSAASDACDRAHRRTYSDLAHGGELHDVVRALINVQAGRVAADMAVQVRNGTAVRLSDTGHLYLHYDPSGFASHPLTAADLVARGMREHGFDLSLKPPSARPRSNKRPCKRSTTTRRQRVTDVHSRRTRRPA